MNPLKSLVAAGVSAGLAAPENVDRIAPCIDLGQSVRQLAFALGRNVAAHPIFLKGDFLVFVDMVTGRETAVTPGGFIGWVEQFLIFRMPAHSNRLRLSLTMDEAKVVLEQQVFRDCLLKLTAVHTMRLPVRRVVDGKMTTPLLPAGYDDETGILTVDTLPYPLDWDVERATEYFLDVFSEIPWNGKDEKPDLRQNRSFSVHVFAMLGAYCKGMFAEGTLRRMPTGDLTFAPQPKASLRAVAGATAAHIW